MSNLNINEIKKYDQVFIVSKIDDHSSLFELIEGKKTLVLLLDCNLKKKFSDSKHFKNLKISSFSWSFFDDNFYDRWVPDRKSLNFIEKNKHKILEKNKFSLKILNYFFNHENINNCILKNVASNVKIYFEHLKISEILKKNNILFFNFIDHDLNEYFENYQELDFDKSIFDNNRNLKKNIFFQHAGSFKSSLKFIIYFFYSILTIRELKIFKKYISLGVRIYDNGFGFNENQPNMSLFNKLGYAHKDLLYIFETIPNINHLNDIKKKKFNFIISNKRQPLRYCSLIFLFYFLTIYLPASIILFILSFGHNKFTKNEIFNCWANFLIWKNILQIYNFKNYVSYHDFGTSHIYRNILLNRNGTKTLNLKHTHSENLFSKKLSPYYCNIDMLYQNYNYEFHWSKASLEMSKNNKSFSNNLVISGPFWFDEKMANPNLLILPKKKKTISFFLSSYEGKKSMIPISSQFKILNLIKEIAKSNGDYNFIIKPKYSLDYLKNNYDKTNIISILERNLSNLTITDNNSNSLDIIQESEIVISTAFSSPTFEAMSLGIKSYYVDILSKFKDSHFSSFKYFVSHGHQDAIKYLEYWMSVNEKIYKSEYEKMLTYFSLPKNNNDRISLFKKELEAVNVK